MVGEWRLVLGDELGVVVGSSEGMRAREVVLLGR